LHDEELRAGKMTCAFQYSNPFQGEILKIFEFLHFANQMLLSLTFCLSLVLAAPTLATLQLGTHQRAGAVAMPQIARARNLVRAGASRSTRLVIKAVGNKKYIPKEANPSDFKRFTIKLSSNIL
jgi:hypothetical protein